MTVQSHSLHQSLITERFLGKKKHVSRTVNHRHRETTIGSLARLINRIQWFLLI